MKAIKEKHATPRKTEIVPDEGEIAIEDLIVNEGVIITLTTTVCSSAPTSANTARNGGGGKGVIGMTTREGETADDKDFVEHLFTASTHDYLMFFTNTGRVYVERVHEIPDMGRAAKGRSIANLLELKADEKSCRAHPHPLEDGCEQGGRDVAAARRTFLRDEARHGKENFL